MENGRTNTLAQDKVLVGRHARVLHVDRAAGSGRVGGRPGLASHPLSQACSPPARAQAALGGQQAAAGGGGQAHFCWVHSSPHWGPLHTLLCGLHLSWDAGGVGRSPSVPHHPWLPCPLPTRPSTAPRVSSSGHAICFLLGLDEQPRRPRSGLSASLSARQSGPGSLETPARGAQGAVWLGLRKRDSSGLPWDSQATPYGQSLRSCPPGTQWARCSQR